MRVPVSWLREVALLPDVPTHELAARLTAAGLTVETVTRASSVTGPLVVGRVLAFDAETHKNGKTVRWCTVDTGDAAPRGIVCGADNFAAGDAVAVALPGVVLPGGFAITARKTYGHVSDGMICSAAELGIGADAGGILVLAADVKPGDDAAALLGLDDEVLDIAVTTDRGYAMSVRGVAREAATAFGTAYADPAGLAVDAYERDGYPAVVEDPTACPRFVLRAVSGVDPAAASPDWLQRRVRLAGMRPISLVVDVTNYVMLELGQPIHAYDREQLRGPVVVRRARPGESLRTLDGQLRALDPDDLAITDDSGPIGVAGVMGGASTEVGDSTIDVVIEAAAFAPAVVGRASRRHRLPSEASRRFERGVDPALGEAAAQRVVDLLVVLGGGTAEPAATVVGALPERRVVRAPADLAQRRIGTPVPREEVVRLLEAVGCDVRAEGDDLVAEVPTWRPDLRDPADLVEEVARLRGYDVIPSVLPQAPAGRGWTSRQRALRRVGELLAAGGYVEAPCYPFVADEDLDALGLPPDDTRRHMLRLTNPFSEAQPYLRTTLLPGLLTALRRNLSRGASDVALFETGLVFRPEPGPLRRVPRPSVERRPADEELAELLAAVPPQPRRVAVVLSGRRDPAGWWGAGRDVSWADAVEAARTVAQAWGVAVEVSADDHAPWHPGRCAALHVDGVLVGHAGELHPRVVAAFGLPARTAAMEVELDRLGAPDRLVAAPRVSTFPPATQDVALVVDAAVPQVEVARALLAGAGPLLESLRLFDVYTGDQVGAGRKSLAYALRFRARDRTLTVEEATAMRDAAVAEAGRRTGAVLRSA